MSQRITMTTFTNNALKFGISDSFSWRFIDILNFVLNISSLVKTFPPSKIATDTLIVHSLICVFVAFYFCALSYRYKEPVRYNSTLTLNDTHPFPIPHLTTQRLLTHVAANFSHQIRRES